MGEANIWQPRKEIKVLGAVQSFSTLVLAAADPGLIAGDTVSIKKNKADDGGGGLWDVLELTDVVLGTGVVASTGGQIPALALRQQDIKLKTTVFNVSPVTVLIPTDFPDLQSAADFYLNSATKANVQINLRIEAGHQLTGGIGVYNTNAANFVITSADAIVTLAAGFVGVAGITVGDINGEVPANPLFYGFNAGMPQLKCLIDMANLHGSGYFGVNSRGFVHGSCGVINAGFRGIQWRAGHIYAANSNFNGANAAGARFHQAATGTVGGGTFNFCCKTLGDSSAIYVSRGCTMELRFASATDSFAGGITCRRSIISAGDVDVSRAVTFGVLCESVGSIDFINGTSSNCGTNGIISSFDSRVAAHSATVANNGTVDIRVLSGGEVGINPGTTTTSGSEKIDDYIDVFAFNVRTENGIVVNDEGIPAFKTGKGGTGGEVVSTRYADDRQDAHGELDLTTASTTEIKGTLTFPEAFKAGEDPTFSIVLPGSDSKWNAVSDRSKISCVTQRFVSTTTMEVVVHVITGQTFSGTFINEVQVRAIGRFL